MRNTLLFLKASAAVALVASNASAFDQLNWEWNKTVDETVIKDIFVFAEINPTGMTEIQKLQIQVGDVTANSNVSGITNNPPVSDGGSGVVTISERFFIETIEDEDDPDLDIKPIGGIEGDDPTNGITANFLGGEIIEIDDAPDGIELTFEIEGDVPFEAGEIVPLDAVTELPTVESLATAVGNNQSIESAVSTQLHEAQILFDVCGECGENGNGPIGDPGLVAGLGNTFHQAGFATALAAAVGDIDKANITATSTVDNILNARVDSSATAVGNNLSVDMSAALPGDQLLIADLTQVSVADILATSSVTNVSLNNYTNLGDASVNPIVSSSATAVGNNVSINVGVPSVGN